VGERAEEEAAAPAPGALTAVERDELPRLRKQVKRLDAVLCSVLSGSRSGFYAWQQRPEPTRPSQRAVWCPA
jgi:hypothetical protein